jgi:hypothetical protein
MQKNLPSGTGPHKMPAPTARKKKESVCLIFFVENHRGSNKPSMTGVGEDGIKLGLRQSGKEPGAEIFWKRQNLAAR